MLQSFYPVVISFGVMIISFINLHLFLFPQPEGYEACCNICTTACDKTDKLRYAFHAAEGCVHRYGGKKTYC